MVESLLSKLYTKSSHTKRSDSTFYIIITEYIIVYKILHNVLSLKFLCVDWSIILKYAGGYGSYLKQDDDNLMKCHHFRL